MWAVVGPSLDCTGGVERCSKEGGLTGSDDDVDGAATSWNPTPSALMDAAILQLHAPPSKS
jgi:hypothetical protein